MTDKPLTPDPRRPYTAEIGMDALVKRADGSTINFGDAIYHPENADEARAYVARVAAPSDGPGSRQTFERLPDSTDPHTGKPIPRWKPVAAPSDGHTHYPVTDVTGTVFSYTHPAPVCPYCVAAPSDGLRERIEALPWNPWRDEDEPLGPDERSWGAGVEWYVGEYRAAVLAELDRAALAATEQPETDHG
jgi:hypothetical protein